MRLPSSLTAALCGLIFSLGILQHTAHAARLPFQGLDEGTLLQLGAYGPILLVEEKPQGDFPWVSAGVLIDAPADVVWEVITDFESYPDYIPQMQSAEVALKKDKITDVDMKLRVEFTSLIGVNVSYSLRYLEMPPHRLIWQRTKGDVKYTRGEWNLLPVEGGRRTLAFYSFSSDLRSMNAIVGYVLDKQPSLEVAIQSSTGLLAAQATKERAEKLFEASTATTVEK